MKFPLAYLSGRMIPAHEAALPLHDAGIVSGVTVTDFCRTFRHRLFRWEDHLARFRHDCAACFIPLPTSDEELTRTAHELIAHNAAMLPAGGELALVTFATPGGMGVYAGTPGQDGPPTLAMHTFPLVFDRYRRFFTEGVALAIVGHHGGSEDDLAPPGVKHRSRLHWWRADHLLRMRTDVPPGALALALDGPEGALTETAIGNLLLVRDGTVLRAPVRTVLEGIAQRVTCEQCAARGIPVVQQRLTRADVATADEVMLTGTAFGLVGVRWVEGVTLPWPGPLTRLLQADWNSCAGLDIAAQVCGRPV